LQVYRDFECDKKGTTESSCEVEFEIRELETCSELCIQGECVDECPQGDCGETEIECFNNLDCGIDGFKGGEFCVEKNVVREFERFSCVNSGTTASFCQSDVELIVSSQCADKCVQGECVDVEIECFINSDCGVDRFVEEPFCAEFNERLRLYRSFICENAGTDESKCLTQDELRVIEVCDEMCILGECVDIRCFVDSECEDFNPLTIDFCSNAGTSVSKCENVEINCVLDNDCGFTGYLGNEYCSEDDVFKNFQTAKCHNSGGGDSFCTIEVIEDEIFRCDFACVDNGICVRCDGDFDCDDYNNYTEDKCMMPGTVESYCDNDGREPQCGDGILDDGEECDDGNNDNWDGCSNECEIENSGCYTNEECDDYDSLTYDQCVNAGTIIARCENTIINCAVDYDCGVESLVGETYCIDGDVYRNQQEYICLDAESLMSACTSWIDAEWVEGCEYGCFEGSCVACEDYDNNSSSEDWGYCD